MENYIHHRDVFMHKQKIRFHITIFILPIFLVLLVELLILTSNRSIIPKSRHSYTVDNPLYVSPLASSPGGKVQVGIGGAPPNSAK